MKSLYVVRVSNKKSMTRHKFLALVPNGMGDVQQVMTATAAAATPLPKKAAEDYAAKLPLLITTDNEVKVVEWAKAVKAQIG